MINEKIITINIGDYMANKIRGFGEINLDRIISSFFSIDPHVESFLKNNSELSQKS